MVNDADVVIAYVQHSWGDAAQTLEYVEQKRKRIILYKETVEHGTQNKVGAV
ncbi:hypothetical protein [Enterococcus faecalis]|uniref:hypothetical protein n=1 Tax=Enterococcus faecalis TaxID=1351 RepID=UPI0032E029AC